MAKCSHGYGAHECQNSTMDVDHSYCRKHARQADLIYAADRIRAALRKRMHPYARRLLKGALVEIRKHDGALSAEGEKGEG